MTQSAEHETTNQNSEIPSDQTEQEKLPGLDDLDDEDTTPEEPEDKPTKGKKKADVTPFSNEQVMDILAGLTAMGLPFEQAVMYAEDFKRNGLLNAFIPFLKPGEALAHYGIGNGGGLESAFNPPPIVALIGTVALVGYVTVQMRKQYAENPPRPTETAPAHHGDTDGAGSYASGFSTNFSGSQG